MGWFGKYWKVILAILLLIAAVLAVVFVYMPGKAMHELQTAMLEMQSEALNTRLQTQLEENRKLESIKDKVDPALKAVDASAREIEKDRAILYANFPGGILEEDQILYVMDLENILGMEVMFGRTYNSLSNQVSRDVDFEFGEPQAIGMLTDQTMLDFVNIKLDFDMPYESFKQMLVFLADDARITSIRYAKIDYDPYNGHVVGYAWLSYYYLDSSDVPYEAPQIDGQEAGRDSLF